MPLVPMRDIMQDGAARGYAAGAFNITDAVTLKAVIDAADRAELSFLVGGVIAGIAVTESTEVAAGDVIARLDARDFDDQAVRFHEADDAEALVFPELGIALVGGDGVLGLANVGAFAGQPEHPERRPQGVADVAASLEALDRLPDGQAFKALDDLEARDVVTGEAFRLDSALPMPGRSVRVLELN